jgi:hypothetical protein
MSPFGWDYPAGLEHHPGAPWNERDEETGVPAERDWDALRDQQKDREMEDAPPSALDLDVKEF